MESEVELGSTNHWGILSKAFARSMRTSLINFFCSEHLSISGERDLNYNVYFKPMQIFERNLLTQFKRLFFKECSCL